MNEGNPCMEHYLSPTYLPYEDEQDHINYGSVTDNLDYDSDASNQTRVVNQSNTHLRTHNPRAPSQRQRFLATTSDYAEYHTEVFPVIYKFSESIIGVPEKTQQQTATSLQSTEKISFSCLKDLVNFRAEDLRLRGWNLLSLEEKNSEFAPFSILPDCPNVLETRFANIFDISKFMYDISLDLTKRCTSIDSLYSVSKLVKAGINAEVSGLAHDFTSEYSFDESVLESSWEFDPEESVSLQTERFQSTDEVTEFDFCIALASTACEKRLPLKGIQLLHQIANKCLFGSRTHILGSWGVRHVAQLLITQLNEAIQSPEEEATWILAALSLLWKIITVYSNIDLLLSLLQWNYLNMKKVGSLSLVGIAPLVNCVEFYGVGRIRLSLPTTRYGERHISFAHLLKSIQPTAVKGLCVTRSDRDLCCVLFTTSGVYKVSLKPPFNLITQNTSYVTLSFRSLFVEQDRVVIWEGPGKDMDVLDLNTLEPCERVKSPLSLPPCKSRNGFVIYTGRGQFVSPYYHSAGQAPRNVSFGGTEFSGTMEPCSILLPRTTDSLSVQFFMYATPPANAPTTMEIVSACIGDKKWLTVKVTLDHQIPTMRLTFEHGKDAVAEFQEPICSEWVLWSATLTSLNYIASWVIYRNGVCCDAQSQSGSLVKPSDALFLNILKGRFTGYLASIQVWSREQTIEDMILFAMEGKILKHSQFLLCSFPLDEGTGFYFHSKCSGLVFRGQHCNWVMCPKSLPGKRCDDRKTFWKPHGEYYLTTNDFEIVVVEEGYSTWISKEGRILEQQPTIFSPSDRIFYSPIDGMIYSVMHDDIGVSSIQPAGSSAHSTKELLSIKRCKAFIKGVFDSVRDRNLCSVYDIALYMAYLLNMNLILTKENYSCQQNFLSLNVISTVSLKTVEHLLSICREMIGFIVKGDISDLEKLVFCIAGRLLTQQVRLMQRRCPSEVVSEIISVYHYLQGDSSIKDELLVEALNVFSDLHKTILAECVSYDYQLRLINESTNFKEVIQLLQPSNLLSLVCAVIEKDMKKTFMSFLNHLKKECKTETLCIFTCKPVEWNASEALLTVILGMLSQKVKPHWHLVAVALVDTLCKYILSEYDQCFPAWSDQLSKLDLLKKTFIGVALFPVAHYLYDMDVDASIVTDYLKAAKNTYDRLQRYALATHDSSPTSIKVTDTYSIVPREESSTDFHAKLDLRYANSIRVEMNLLKSRNEDDSYPQLSVTFRNKDYYTSSEMLPCDDMREMMIDQGGELSFQARIDENCTNVIITVYATVVLNVEVSSWIKCTCQGLIATIIRTPYRTIQKLIPPKRMQIRSSSFLRGGLASDCPRAESVTDLNNYSGLEILENLTGVAERKEVQSTVVSIWKSLFSSKAFPYASRLENIVMWSCSALTWHSLKNLSEGEGVENCMSDCLDLIKKKAFLFLEALQQGREKEIVERAKFLLLNLNPRTRVEARLSELQHTEEPIVGTNSTRHPARASHGNGSMNNRIQSASGFSRGSADTHLLSNAGNGYFSNTSQNSPNHRMTTIRFFNGPTKDDSDLLLNQILVFLINGGEENTTDIISDLSARKQCVKLLINDYTLKEELCKQPNCDSGTLHHILNSHLHHQNSLIQHLYKGTCDKTGNAHEGFDNYSDHCLYGCGLLQELELHKAFCSFVQTALHTLRKRLTRDEDFSLKESLEMCAILCHPWDSVDFSILRPSEVFSFLRQLLSTVFVNLVNKDLVDDDSSVYFESKGLFDLFHRCLIIPNSLLHISIEGVHIVDGEVQGLHVEDNDVVCSARNHWKSLAHVGVLQARAESDWYANYGLPCITTELPGVHYFEITLDFCDCSFPKIFIGLSSFLLTPTDPVSTDQVIRLSSSGVLSFPNHKTVKFDEKWEVEDVIGCGVMAPNNSVFFTRNGEFIGIATVCDFASMIPFVEVQGKGSLMRVLVNFGRDQAFKFNIATLHSSCRHRYLTPATVCDAAMITLHYLITMCFTSFSSREKLTAAGQDAVSDLLEKSSEFLYGYISDLIELYNSRSSNHSGTHKNATTRAQGLIVSMLSQLFHCLSLVIECFGFDTITPQTHSRVLQTCAFALTNAHSKWIKMRAAQCLCLVRKVMRVDLLLEAAELFGQSAATQDIISQLFELTRSKHADKPEAPRLTPTWLNNTTMVKGKGVFFGSATMPNSGTHIIGFRIRRNHQPDQEDGSPLGGCYYVGLCHGQPQIKCMNSLIHRRDVYVLQDTDDQDQVSHLLLRRQTIPKNTFRRIYGNNEVVWVQFNADVGEITFYRENMILIGLAFANIEKTDDLYPIVFLFNEDALCEILPGPVSASEPAEYASERLCQSIAIDALQQLHLIPPFQTMITRELHRSITHLDRNLEGCLASLAVLGGKRSYQYCLHNTFGLLVLYAVADITRKAVVYLASDQERQLFAVPLKTLKPSFVPIPLYSSGNTTSEYCAALLINELCRILYEATFITPHIRQEEEARKHIEEEHARSIEAATTLDLIGILSDQANCTHHSKSGPQATDTFLAHSSTSSLITTVQPIVIDRHCSTKCLFTPNPSVGVTTTQGTSTLRANVIFDPIFSFSLVIAQCPSESLLYVGITASTSTFPQGVEEVANWEDTWALCSFDSAKTNSINCCLQPGMIFSGGVTLFTLGDILTVRVNRYEGTVAFLRTRKGKHRVDFGVLFEGIPSDILIRPIVVCGPDTIVAFSFIDGVTFPSRNTFPVSNFTRPVRKFSAECSLCQTLLVAPWYGSGADVILCEQCFLTWQYPKELFFVDYASSDAASIPRYLTSSYAPERLIENHYIEFEENCVLSWSSDRSVNIKVDGASCVSIFDEAFAITEPLSIYGTSRVDVQIGYIAGVSGHPFSGLLSFTPLWREDQRTVRSCVLQGDSLLISSSVIPFNTKALFSVQITEAKPNCPIVFANVFIGVSNFSDFSYSMTRVDMERLCANSKIWGTWCDSKEKVLADGTIFVLLDCTHGTIRISATLEGLHYNPFTITCSLSPEYDETLHLAIFSQDTCQVTSLEGFASYSDPIEPSLSPMAIGLVPATFSGPSENIFQDCIMLMDTIPRTEAFTSDAWEFSEYAISNNNGTLFHIDDTLTFIREKTYLRVFCQGILTASLQINEEQASRYHCLMLYFSVKGLSATFVPPLYGYTHLGRVVKVCGPEVGIVECVDRTQGKRRFTVRRKDVRFCALSASTYDRENIKQGTQIVFKTTPMQSAKRGTVLSISGDTISVRECQDERAIISLKMDQSFVLDNEGKQMTRQVIYPLVVPSSTATAVMFEVGKSKYRMQCKGSHNGIMFDCHTNSSIDITGLSVLSHTSGRHHVDVYVKKGSHKGYERDSHAWMQFFTGFVEMQAKQQFALTFTPIYADAGDTIAFFINTSHNCGVGFYCEDDGCHGEVGSVLDNDDTITVYLGRKSDNSIPFRDISTVSRGFCGGIVYRKTQDSKPPLIQGSKCSAAIYDPSLSIGSAFCKLISRSPRNMLSSSIRFTIEVLNVPARVKSITVSVILRGSENNAHSLFRYVISTLYCPIKRDMGTGEEMPSKEWHWAWNTRVLLNSTSNDVVLQGSDIKLSKGRYLIALVVRKVSEEYASCEDSHPPLLICPTDVDYTKQNTLISVSGFYGDIRVAEDELLTLGKTHTMTTGTSLVQSNSASYNGIMFDLRSQQDIRLEEIFFIPQTNANYISVRLFWKEGSMIGAEKSPLQWSEVASKEMKLVDKELFSIGPLFLRMKANQTYAIYVNTSSSCGVRFYNNSDTVIGHVGDEFENDGILSIFVGCKSESSFPFAEIPPDPRAFRGKIVYRTHSTAITEPSTHALFSFARGLVLTRILLALSSYVELQGTSGGGSMYQKLLSAVMILATLPANRVKDLNTIDSMLLAALNDYNAEDLRKQTLAVPLLGEKMPSFSSINNNDLGILIGPSTPTSISLIRVRNANIGDNQVLVSEPCAAETYPVCAERIIPLTKCWRCSKVYATTELCECTNAAHSAPPDEESRIIITLASAIAERFNQAEADSVALAKLLLQNPSMKINDDLLHRTENDTSSSFELQITAIVKAPNFVVYQIPMAILVTEEETEMDRSFRCPFVYCQTLGAFISLSVKPTAYNVSFNLIMDLPIRAPALDRDRCYALELHLASDNPVDASLTDRTFSYLISSNATVNECILPSLPSALLACLSSNGLVSLCLSVRDASFDAATHPVQTNWDGESWTWENGTLEVELCSEEPMFIAGEFSIACWPSNKRHFASFVVVPEESDKTVFLEVHVVAMSSGRLRSSGLTGRKVLARRPFSLVSGEVVTLGFSTEDEFFIFDANDAIRCRVKLNDQVKPEKFSSLHLGFVCVDQERVTAILSTGVCNKRSAGLSSFTKTPSYVMNDFYVPVWTAFDPSRVNLSKDKSLASCSTEVGGQAVVGSAIPDQGVSFFQIRIDRYDRSAGSALGSGHFAGVSGPPFSTTSPLYSELKTMENVWVVQDVQDADSLPNQESIPPIRRRKKTNELYCVGTRLLFVVDRNAGTLSLARDDESPRVVFQNIPRGMCLRPFVRLDHSRSYATLTHFSHRSLCGPPYYSSSEKALLSQPITPTFLRRVPLPIVLKLYPIMHYVINAISAHRVGELENSWNNLSIHTRFEYRLYNAIEKMIEMGAFSREMFCCDSDKMSQFVRRAPLERVVQSLSRIASYEIAGFPISDPDDGSGGKVTVYFRLPDGYEIVGAVEGTDMIRVVYVDAVKGPTERTLYLIRLGCHNCTLPLCNEVLPHSSAVQIHTILRPLNNLPASGVIIDGWFNHTLATFNLSSLEAKQLRKIAAAIVCGVEHWHLHGIVHGHLLPENVLLRVEYGVFIRCALWKAYYLDPTSIYASPALQMSGVRDISGDLWGCAQLYKCHLKPYLSDFPIIENSFEMLRRGESSISNILDDANVFKDTPEGSGEGPSFTLRTGARLRGGSGSYNGIMFDVLAKSTKVRVTKLSFFPDTTTNATVTLFTRDGTFLGYENDASAWRKILETQMLLSDSIETVLEGFDAITIPAWSRAGLFIHTTSGSGVLFYSETEGVTAAMGHVEEESSGIGISVGKKSESNRPFTAIQNQKRLLKGSITYTLITRSNGPRSSLIYTCDANATVSKQPSLHMLIPVHVKSKGLGVQFLSSSNKAKSLIAFEPGKYQWVDTVCVDAASYTDMTTQLRKHQTYLSQKQLEYHEESILHAQCVKSPWGSLRRLLFAQLAPCTVGGVPYQPNPTIFQSTTWISERLEKSCVVSIWVPSSQSNLGVYVCEDAGEPIDLGSFVDTQMVSSVNVLENCTCVFLHVDMELGCVFMSNYTKVLKSASPMIKCLGFRIAVHSLLNETLEKKDITGSPVFAYVNVLDDRNCYRVDDGSVMLLLRNAEHIVSTSVCGVEIKCERSAMKNTTRLLFVSITGLAYSAHITELGTDRGKAEIAKTHTTTDVIDEATVEFDDTVAPALFIDVRRVGTWSLRRDVILTGQSPSLEISERVATQVLRTHSCKCRVLSPPLKKNEIHHVLVRMICPPGKPIGVSLEHLYTSETRDVNLPYAFFNDGMASWLLQMEMREIFVHLHIDMYRKQIYITSSTGTFKGISNRHDIVAESCLAFTFDSPGSRVEIVSWSSLNAHTELSLRPETLSKVAKTLGTPLPSLNVSHNVGSIVKHPPRSNGVSLQEGKLSVAKQLKILLINYAQLLLEKTLVSQEPARQAAQSKLHFYLSCTALCSSPVLSSVVESEIRRGSFSLIAQSCTYLLAPVILQRPAGVKTSVNVLAIAIRNDIVRKALGTDFGPSLMLLLLRVATAFSHTFGHNALRCVQQLAANKEVPLPSHELLAQHMSPLLKIMTRLCKRGEMGSTVVQIGVGLVADIIERYRLARPSLVLPGLHSSVPFPIVICARALIGAITAKPPRPLPKALVQARKSTHAIQHTLVTKPPDIHGLSACYGTFSESNRDTQSIKTFEVVLKESRKGAVIVGWDLDYAPENPMRVLQRFPCFDTDHEPLPSCGYYIDPFRGDVFVCLGRKKEKKPLKVKAKQNDVIVVSCSYSERLIKLCLRRDSENELTTNFSPTTVERVALPFCYLQHNLDATMNFDGLNADSEALNLSQIYAELHANPHELDATPAQSYEFYLELNLFCQAVLEKEPPPGPVIEKVHTHEVAGYPHLAELLQANVFDNTISINALAPYRKRLRIFDSLMLAFSPLINLKQKSELYDIFRVLKNLCSKPTEEKFQAEIMRPFQNRVGKRAHVTIHLMQARPSAHLGPHPTLMRSVFGQLYLQLQHTNIETFYVSPIFTVKLVGFGSTDAGGPYRDVLSQLAAEIMTTHPSNEFQTNPLFSQYGSEDVSAVMPNTNLMSSTQTPLMLEFFGKLLGSFFITRDVLAVEFPPLFWKLLLSEPVSVNDLRVFDPNIEQSLDPSNLMNQTEEELEEQFGDVVKTWQLIVGKNPHLSLSTSLPPRTLEAAQLLSDKLVENDINRFAEAMHYIQLGFGEVLPLYTLQAFRWQKVSRLICGTQNLSFEAFKAECDIQLPPKESQMFLSVLKDMSDEDRRHLLRFTTGQCRLPIKNRIKVQYCGARNALPTSSTCFFLLRLPSYSSEELLRERLLYAIRQCNTIDADGLPRENLIINF